MGVKKYKLRSKNPIIFPQRRAPDMRKFIKIFGYTSKVTLVEGINKTLLWYKKIIYNSSSNTKPKR